MDSVHHQLGVLAGRFESIEESMKNISTAIKTIAEHSARVDLLQQARAQHDKRISKLECATTAQRQALEQMKKHIENDTPVEVQFGRYAIGIVLFVGGLVVNWLFKNIPKILQLLG